MLQYEIKDLPPPSPQWPRASHLWGAAKLVLSSVTHQAQRVTTDIVLQIKIPTQGSVASKNENSVKNSYEGN